LQYQPGWKTIHAVGIDWRDVGLGRDAFENARPPISAGTIVISLPAPEQVTRWEMWIERDGRQRFQFQIGQDVAIAARSESGGWTSYWPSQGFRHGDGAYLGQAPGYLLVDLRYGINVLEYVTVGGELRLGRYAQRVVAKAIGYEPFLNRHGLSLGFGADQFEWSVDAEFGVLLRSEAQYRGSAYRIVEMTYVEFNTEFDDSMFVIGPS
jgi:hypothetical protein